MTATPHILGRYKTTAKQAIPCKAADGSYAVASGGPATLVSDVPPKGVNVGIKFIDFAYRVAPTAGSITATDGTNVWGPFTIALAGLQTRYFPEPLLFTPGTGSGTTGQVTVTMADGSQIKDLYVKFVYEGTQTP